MKEKPRQRNLMQLAPKRTYEWKTDAGGLVSILIPKFKGIVGKVLIPRMKNPYFNLNLDQFGSFIWNKCDGTTRVSEISDALQKEFGEEIEPAHERVASFIIQLSKSKALSIE